MRTVLPLLRLANPFVRAVLRSPVHRVLSGSLLVLEYRGRHSGRRFRIPVLYAVDGEAYVVLAARPEAKQWWRTFRGAAPARLTVAGRTTEATGRLLAAGEAVDALQAYVTRFPRAARALGAGADAPPAALADACRRVALVAFVPRVAERARP